VFNFLKKYVQKLFLQLLANFALFSFSSSWNCYNFLGFLWIKFISLSVASKKKKDYSQAHPQDSLRPNSRPQKTPFFRWGKLFQETIQLIYLPMNLFFLFLRQKRWNLISLRWLSALCHCMEEHFKWIYQQRL
jgi:chloramphenicol O-acetyltransferase